MTWHQAFVHSARREWVRLWASPWELAMISWVPLLAGTLLCAIFSAGLPSRLPIGVFDEDHSSLSRQLQRFLQATPGLDVAQRYGDRAEAERALRRGDVAAVVWVPGDFARDIKQGRSSPVTLWHNAQWGTHSGLIQRDVRTVVGTLSAGVELGARQKRGESLQAARVSMEPIRADSRTLFNPSTNYEFFLTCALVPALLHIMAMTAGAWGVGVELRDRSVDGWLQAVAGQPPSIAQVLGALLGKLCWSWLALCLVGSALFWWLMGPRGWAVAGSTWGLWWAFLVFMALSVAMGALVSALTRSLRTALSATGFITAPAFAFGGVGFPLLAMPAMARAWALVLPYTHYSRVQIEQWVMGAPWAVSARTPAWMLLATVAMLGVSALTLRQAATQPDTWGKR
jgi:ABC-2 type transport system permease protein